ncbi:MAG: hypothetical protein PVJ05_14390 [Candidatus Thorarchaeota archaeon]|jgi:hypothetical protein
MGIQRYLDTLRELQRTVTPADWLRIGWDFLKTMGVGELYGCDLNILPIIDRIPPGSDFIDVQTFLQHTVVETLLEKLDEGCTTILLDVDKMDGTPAAVLIPRIHALRAKEMHNISIPVLGSEIIIYDLFMNEIGTEIVPEKGESVLLRDLWLTALGNEILSKLELGFRTTMKGLERIRREFKKSSVKHHLRRVKEESNITPTNVSDAMASLILSNVKSDKKKERYTDSKKQEPA